MKFLALFLNLPWTFSGIILSILSVPKNISFSKPDLALIFNVRSFWWYSWLPRVRGVRAMAIGNVVLLGRNILKNDLEHELIHVEQFLRTPLIHPILYIMETFRKGYRNNTYEEEAYSRSNSIYIEK